ncbi:MAG: RnfABCDGE type electron transport complex subunit G [Paludibacteraceae bacterium]|nr:RnfABCDGE type electron transport complex subunit G [Paludibacteraceae bacterium]
MEKLSNSLLNMTVVLTATAIVTGGLLAFVNDVTKEPIAEVNKQATTDGIVKVMGGNPNIKTDADTIENNGNTFVVYNVTDDKGNALGNAVESSTMGFGGELKVLTGFDAEGNILGYTILGHAETPGLGAKATDWFQKGGKGDIIGKNPAKNNLMVSKDEKDGKKGEVDAITASTITSRAFLKTVNEAYEASAKSAPATDCNTQPTVAAADSVNANVEEAK